MNHFNSFRINLLIFVQIVLISCFFSVYSQPFPAWQKVSTQGMQGASVRQLIQGQSGDVFALTNRTLYRSSNMGGLWLPANVGLPSGVDSLYCIASHSSGVMFAGTIRGICKSSDNGTSWSRLSLNSRVDVLFMDTTGIVFAGTRSTIYRSADTGTTFTQVGMEIPAEHIKGLPMFSYDRVYGLMVTFGVWQYSSLDRGVTWKAYPGSSAGQHYRVFKVGYEKNGIITWSYVSCKSCYGGSALINNRENVSYSIGYALHYSRMEMMRYVGVTNVITDIAFFNADTALIGSYLFGIIKTTIDTTLKYKAYYSNTGLNNIQVLSVLRTSNGICYCGTNGGGIYYSTDGGEHWQERNTGLEEPTVVSILLPTEGDKTFIAGTANGIYVSLDSAKTWEQRSKGIEYRFITSIVKTLKGTLLVGTPRGLFRSVDAGLNWSRVADSIPVHIDDPVLEETKYIGINDFIVFQNNKILAATEGGLAIISSDDGKTWKPQTSNLFQSPDQYTNHIIKFNYSKETGLLASTWAGIYKSLDTGKTWELYIHIQSPFDMVVDVNKTLYTSVRSQVYQADLKQQTPVAGTIRGNLSIYDSLMSAQSIKFDANGKLFLGSLAGGMYSTTDGGINWNSYNKGAEGVKDVYYMAQDVHGYLYACTGDFGLYRTELPTAAVGVPSLLLPTNDSTDHPLDAKLSWNKVADAQKYDVRVSTTPDFKTYVFNDSNITTTTKSYTLKAGVTYYWKVRSSKNGFKGFWSEPWKFTSGTTLPSKPELEYPPNDTTLQGISTSFRWKTTTKSDKYTLLVSNDTLFTNTIQTSENVTTLSLPSVQLESNTAYYWRVQGVNTNGIGEWSDVWKFTTGNSTDVVDELNYDGITISPLPVMNELVVQGLPDTSYLLEVYDAQGKRVYTSTTSSINTRNLANGSYTLGITFKNHTVYKHFVIITR
ncbi:MAG: hypothetical protein U0Y96_10275 [Candidatus Kapaibacterium sp.]|nr:hypothetical protein [Bacteroidota bacterium]